MEQGMNPADMVLQMASGLWMSRAVWAVAHFRIADHVEEDGITVEELAEQTGLQPDRLLRLMRIVTAFGIFRALADGSFAATPASAVLRSDSPHSLRAFIDSVFGGEHYEAFGRIGSALSSPATGFEAHFDMPCFEFYTQNPDRGALFAQAMSDFTGPIDETIAAFDFPPFKLAVDIGGSMGTLLSKILPRYPDASGIVFDLPDVAGRARAALADTPRLEAVGGNFFDEVPGDGDLYFLKFILHDWTDAQSVAILKNIRAAMKPDSALYIMEMVLPDDLSPHAGWLLDYNMMAMTGGRERTRSEYESLLAESGFRLDSATPAPPNMTILGAVPA
ncbi:methyltransferase [Emcibacter nanhaiensis]|uniref:Methyltransferase n=1 Tax=Emcibacter nanhaiensis TaxID=1505037 RepID=A0A501PB90_9PROT|nr:methyltransferase [Emcibacter nanhaiensis]TPD57458.1 methyltransferase [Emcibacter nanhaiensis]